MDEKETKAKRLEIKRLIIEMLNTSSIRQPDELDDGMSLGTDLGCDELDKIELVIAAEETFSIDIKDDDLDGITTVGRLVDCVMAQLD